MAFRQLHPLEVNSTTGEPFLRLPAPRSHIIVTPPRLSDAEAVIQHLNDSRVYTMLNGPPFPYLANHADSWLSMVKKGSDAVMDELKLAQDGDPRDEAPLKIVSGCPVRILREVTENGDIYLGDCSLTRWSYQTIKDPEEKTRLSRENETLPVGDPNILWDVGDYLAASHQGRGIMTSVLATILREWGIPRMGIRKMRGCAFKENIGSIRVFQKLGFEYVETSEDCVDLASCGREGKRSLYCLERTFTGAPGEI